jgi:nucleoside-triphosphatase THEP1
MVDVLNCRIVLITGERQVGKSTALRSAVTGLRDAGMQVSGLLTHRTGPHDLEVTELHSGASYALTQPFTTAHKSPTRNFAMDPEALQRSSEAMRAGFPTEVFILDEIGPLELVHQQGWVAAFELLKQEVYTLACLVIRPDLLGAAINELPGSEFTLLRVTLANRSTLPDKLVRLALATTSASQKGRAESTTGSLMASFNEEGF